MNRKALAAMKTIAGFLRANPSELANVYLSRPQDEAGYRDALAKMFAVTPEQLARVRFHVFGALRSHDEGR